jgi:branched-chain amino acid transport system substrate-binding protein
MPQIKKPFSRRTLVKAGLTGAAYATVPTGWAIAQAKPLKIGIMLPFSGTLAVDGERVLKGFELLLAEKGGKLGGRDVEIIKLDDESKPELAPQNAERLVKRDNVDVIIGTVHSGVQMGIHKVVKESGTLCICPNAGAGAVTRELCAKNVFRVSFSNWQPAYGMGLALAKKGVKKASWITWDYAAGTESGEGFKQGLEAGGAQFVSILTLKFPETTFQPLLAQVPSLGVDAVGAFFSGGGAVQFVKEYAAAGLKVPLCGSGFMTDGLLQAEGAAAEGIETALHYGDGLDNPKDKTFRAAYKAKNNSDPSVFSVQGYDAGQLLAAGVEAVKGNLEDEKTLYKAMETTKIDSPRGSITMSPQHNVIQDIYLRKVINGENKVQSTIIAQLADPGTGCKMST